MTLEEALSYIESHGFSRWRLGLSRIEALMDRLGHPEQALKFVHVAGSNGKGSVCAMIERILREAGYRTGLFPSPYLEDFRERIRVSGEYITEEALTRLTEQVKHAADAMADHPTQFELITAIGFLYFAESACDLVVLEVGLGGEFDATNVIGAPECAVLTHIGLEHTEYLGHTLSEIAATKSGIIKEGSSVVCQENDEEVLAVVREVCARRGCPLRLSSRARLKSLSSDLYGHRFFLSQPEEEDILPADVLIADSLPLSLPLPGLCQADNVATALSVIEVLRARGFSVSDEAVRQGLLHVRWEARFEVLSFDPLFILDGGHNPQCAEALAESIRVLLCDGQTKRRVVFLAGVLADKDVDGILSFTSPYAKEAVCLSPASPRALPARELAEKFLSRTVPAHTAQSAEEGVRLALAVSDGAPVIAFGSLYLAGALRSAFLHLMKKNGRRKALDARRALSAEERREGSLRLVRALTEYPALREASLILSYRASDAEIDPADFDAWAKRHGKRVAYPLIREDGVMEAVLPEDENAFITGAYGIPSPDPERAVRLDAGQLDAVLVPCVAFDREGRRLGHGAGYFDRFLQQLRPDCLKILLAFEAQRLKQVTTERFDVPLPLIATEEGIRAACGAKRHEAPLG